MLVNLACTSEGLPCDIFQCLGGIFPPCVRALFRSEYARSEMGDVSSAQGAADEPGSEHDLMPGLPPSWVPKLAVARDMMDMRCPRVSAVLPK